MPGRVPSLRAWRDGAWLGEWPLDPSRALRVGRSRSCDILLDEDDDLISRVHLEVRPVDGGWEAVDLGSSRGTLLDGAKISSHRLRSGDRLKIGRTYLVAVDLEPEPLAVPAGPRRANRPAVSTSALALAFALVIIAAAGLVFYRYGSRLAHPLPAATRARPTPPEATSLRSAPGSDAAARALLDPSPDEAPRVTPLGSFATTADGGRFQHELVAVNIPAGALPTGQAVKVARVDAAPAPMREGFPVAKWGRYAPVSPLIEVDPGTSALRQPATVSFPVPEEARSSKLTVLSWDPRTRVWDSFDARFDAGSGRAVAEVNHFCILALGALLVTLAGAALHNNWDYIASAQCIDSTGNHFLVCWNKSLGTASSAYVTPGEKGPETVLVPPLVADLATALESAHAAYAAASLKVPASKTAVYIKPYPIDAEYQAPAVVGNPFLYINEKATSALAQASAAHEYFHYVQYLYLGSKISPWWREASAVAVETTLHPQNTSWLNTYYSPGNSGTAELEFKLGRIDEGVYGYRVALFAIYLARARGGLDFQRQVLEKHVTQPILQALSATVGGDAELTKAWLAYGRSLVGPDWGAFLKAHEKRILAREYPSKGHVLDPARGWVADIRPETPLSAEQYEVRFARNRIPQNKTVSGPILVRLTSGSAARVLHVIAPSPAPQPGTPAAQITTLPVTRSLTDADKATEVRRLTSGRVAANSIDVVGWLVDAELQPSGNPVDVRVTWLLPPVNLHFDKGQKKLLWDVHPLAATTARPAAPFDGYAVYKRTAPNAAPQLVGVTQDPEHEIKSVDDRCFSYAVAARLRAAEVKGTAESDKSDWVAVDLPEPKDFTLEGRLEPRKDGPAKEVEVTASEAALGVRGLEIEATVGSKTTTLYTRQRTAQQQLPGTWRPDSPVLFTPPPPGTAYKIVARAWLLPRDHRCFDKARHLLEKVIAEEKTAAPPTEEEGRTVIHDTTTFKGPRAAVEVGVGKASCIGTGPNNKGKRTELTFSELPKLAELKLDGTIAMELKVRSEPGAPVLNARYWEHGLLFSQRGGTQPTAVQDGYTYNYNPDNPPTLQPGTKQTDSREWQLLGAVDFEKGGARSGAYLDLLCHTSFSGIDGTTQFKVRWMYGLEGLYQPGGPGGTAPSVKDFDFGGRFRAHYKTPGGGEAIFLELVERDAQGRLRTYQPTSTITGRTEDRQQRLPRLEGTVGADGSLSYTIRVWQKGREAPQERVKESGQGRVTILDPAAFRVEMTLFGKATTVTYKRLP